MKRKSIITLLTVSMICLSSCGKSDDIEPVNSEAVEVEEETTVDEVENIIEDEPTQDVVEVDTVEEDKETDTTSQTNGAGEQITPKEEDYFKEAEELWALHQEELVCNWETFRETFISERSDNKLSKDKAYDVVYELFKFIEEEPEQSAKTGTTTSSSSSSSTTTSSQSQQSQTTFSTDEVSEETAEAKAFWDSLGESQISEAGGNYSGYEVTGEGWEGITAQ